VGGLPLCGGGSRNSVLRAEIPDLLGRWKLDFAAEWDGLGTLLEWAAFAGVCWNECVGRWTASTVEL